MVYNVLTNSPSPIPCYDVITYTPTNYPSSLYAGSNSGLIKVTAISTGDAYLKEIEFSVTLSNSVNPSALLPKTFTNQRSEFMIGHCDRTLKLDLDYTYATTTVTVTR